MRLHFNLIYFHVGELNGTQIVIVRWGGSRVLDEVRPGDMNELINSCARLSLVSVEGAVSVIGDRKRRLCRARAIHREKTGY